LPRLLFDRICKQVAPCTLEWEWEMGSPRPKKNKLVLHSFRGWTGWRG